MLKENLCLIKINNNISKDFLEGLFLPNILNIIQLWISQETIFTTTWYSLYQLYFRTKVVNYTE